MNRKLIHTYYIIKVYCDLNVCVSPEFRFRILNPRDDGINDSETLMTDNDVQEKPNPTWN